MFHKLRRMRDSLNEKRRLEHGWEVELRCSNCGHDAPPAFDGWAPNHNIGFGKTPTIFANVTCTKCNADLKKVAGEKLVELFADVSMPSGNRNAIWAYVILAIVFLGCLGGKIWLRQPAFDLIYPVIFVAFMASRFWFTHFAHSARHKCGCGQPSYKFMGMMGRSYCFRCSSCGKLLRIRD